jgi:hypothetical protein
VESIAEGLGAGPLDGVDVDDFADANGSLSPVSSCVSKAVLEGPVVEDGHCVVVGAPEPHAYTGGLSLENQPWQRRMAAEERAVVPSQSSWLCDDDGMVRFEAGEGRIFPCTVEEGVEGVVTIPAHRQDVSGLLEWNFKGGHIRVGPAIVKHGCK